MIMITVVEAYRYETNCSDFFDFKSFVYHNIPYSGNFSSYLLGQQFLKITNKVVFLNPKTKTSNASEQVGQRSHQTCQLRRSGPGVEHQHQGRCDGAVWGQPWPLSGHRAQHGQERPVQPYGSLLHRVGGGWWCLANSSLIVHIFLWYRRTIDIRKQKRLLTPYGTLLHRVGGGWTIVGFFGCDVLQIVNTTRYKRNYTDV